MRSSFILLTSSRGCLRYSQFSQHPQCPPWIGCFVRAIVASCSRRILMPSFATRSWIRVPFSRRGCNRWNRAHGSSAIRAACFDSNGLVLSRCSPRKHLSYQLEVACPLPALPQSRGQEVGKPWPRYFDRVAHSLRSAAGAFRRRHSGVC
jgi:hypothetical protein